MFLKSYYLPGDLKTRIAEFVDHYNTERYQESRVNLTPADVYTGRGQTVLEGRRKIKQKKTAQRRRLYYDGRRHEHKPGELTLSLKSGRLKYGIP